jgi:hypothetical protein
LNFDSAIAVKKFRHFMEVLRESILLCWYNLFSLSVKTEQYFIYYIVY